MTLPTDLTLDSVADAPPGSVYLSKSKFLLGLQCHKLIWHAYNAKDLIPEVDAATQAIFDQGHEVGALAKQMFPDGVEVGDGILDLDETIRLTQERDQNRPAHNHPAFPL